MTRSEAEDFLFHECALLDAWRLDEWLALWAREARYIVPATDVLDADPGAALALIADDRALLEARVRQLIAGTTHAEQPRARVHHLVSNVRVAGDRIASNQLIHVTREERLEVYPAHVEHVIEGGRIREKRVRLACELVGRLSFLL